MKISVKPQMRYFFCILTFALLTMAAFGYGIIHAA